MKKILSEIKKIIPTLVLLLAAVIWGGSFVAQSKGGSLIGPLSFGFIRFFVATLAMLPTIPLIDRINGKTSGKSYNKKDLFKGGVLCGICLSVTAIFQQLGLFYGTSSGKAGFITSCYIIFVPLLFLIFKKKSPLNMWIAVVVAIVGLYFLCIKDGFSVGGSDLLVLICSLGCASRILVIDKFMNKVDAVRLATVQFATASVIIGIVMFIVEMKCSFSALGQWFASLNQQALWVAVLYSGVLGGAVAFTLQIVGQKKVNPTLASLLLGLESVFSVLAGWLILHDTLSAREILGCAIIFVSLIIAEVKFTPKVTKKKLQSKEE